MGKIIGFTGTREGMNEFQKNSIWRLLKDYNGEEFHHGCCKGADVEAHDMAVKLDYRMWVHPGRPWNKKYCPVGENWTNLSGNLLSIDNPPKPYLHRNRVIVDVSDRIYATPKQLENKFHRGGTWFTINYAMSKGKEIIIVFPDRLEAFNF